MKTIPFIKMHGLGNDFVIIDCRAEDFKLSASEITEICDRHKGIGCDQLVLIKHSKEADCKVEFYNGDGSQSGACGNATRCVGFLVMLQTEQPSATLETGGGILECYNTGETLENGDELFTVNMGTAKYGWQDIPLAKETDTLEFVIPEVKVLGQASAASMGNPHCVFFVDDVKKADVHNQGAIVEKHELFPQHTNVEFVQVISKNEINLRVWERGAGETLACGSGACAAVAAGVRRKLLANKVLVHLQGGDLNIEIIENGDILMTGPVAIVFTGVIEF